MNACKCITSVLLLLLLLLFIFLSFSYICDGLMPRYNTTVDNLLPRTRAQTGLDNDDWVQRAPESNRRLCRGAATMPSSSWQLCRLLSGV
jgi:hypothetical protein